jgi:GNAT superfamily N-acetyltransferase
MDQQNDKSEGAPSGDDAIRRMALRRYESADREEVCSLNRIALEATLAYLGDGPWNADLEEIEPVYLATGGEFLVGEAGGRIVVMGALKPRGPGTAEIKRMRVHPDVQRHGLGQRMLSALEACARERGYHKLILDTSTIQVAARALYDKNGYRETGRRVIRHLEMIDYEKILP